MSMDSGERSGAPEPFLFCDLSLFGNTILNVIFSLAIISLRKRELVGGAKTLKKLRTSNETTESSSDSPQLRPFSKWERLLKERICSQRQLFFSSKRSSLWYGKPL